MPRAAGDRRDCTAALSQRFWYCCCGWSYGWHQLRSRSRGDAVYEVTIEVPTRLTARQRELLEEFHQISKDQETGSKASSFVERMRKLFGT